MTRNILISILGPFLLIFLAILFSKGIDFLDHRLFKHLGSRIKNMVIIILVICGELYFVWFSSKNIGWSFIDTFFPFSIVFFGLAWFISMSRTTNENSTAAVTRFYGGKREFGDIKAFQFRITPFVLGTIIVALSGLITTVIYYLPYFIS